MNDSVLRPGTIAVAAVLIGGVLIVALPQHAASIVRLVIVTCAAGAGLYVLGLHAAPAWWLSPLDRRRRERRQASDEVDSIRASFGGRRQRIAHGPPLPPETLRLLQPLISDALERAGVSAEAAPSAPGLSAVAAAVLRAEPLSHAGWRSTVKPDALATADWVHRILDEVQSLSAGRQRSNPPGTRERDEHAAHT